MGCGSSSPAPIQSTSQKIETNGYHTKPIVHPQTQSASPKASAPLSSPRITDDNDSHNTPRSTDLLPKPSTRPKKAIVPDVSILNHVDKHVEMTPASAEVSVSQLAKYLSQGMKNDLEKIRSIYQWVRSNISYNVSGFMSGNYGSLDPESVLISRTSVCSGYSDLFRQLCENAGVTVKVISGFAKGYGHDPEKEQNLRYTSKTNHAWNAVYLDNEWRLIDCTWDAGHIDGKNFFKHEGEHYFLTDPEVFINDHLPCIDAQDIDMSEKWQLLKKPVKIEDFAKRNKFDKKFFSYDLTSSENQAVVNCNKEVSICITQLGSMLDEVSVGLVNMENKEDLKNHVLVDLPEPKIIRFYVCPPTKGHFKLTIYGRKNNESTSNPNSLHSLCTYILKCDDYIKKEPYPITYGWWGLAKPDQTKKQPQYHYCTKNGECIVEMEADDNVDVLTRFEHANKSLTSDDIGTIFHKYENGKIKYNVRLKTTGYVRMIVFVKNESGTYEVYSNYLLECSKPFEPFKNFVTVYQFAKENNVHLREPFDKELPNNSKVPLRFDADPSMEKVMVGNEIHSGDGSGSWDLVIHTGNSGTTLNIFGKPLSSSSYNALFGYVSQ